MTDDNAGRSKQEADDEDAKAAEAERRLGRALALGLPPLAIGAAVVVGLVTSAGPAILVLIGGALVGGIALLWASLRTLGGDAPLSQELEAVAAFRGARGELTERKQTAIRALKDLELEHDIGKIDDADYKELQSTYREEAKDALRQLDLEVEPFREKAEAIARKHLAAAGLGDVSPDKEPASEREAEGEAEAVPTASEKPSCPKCSASNDTDAAFCKKCGASLTNDPADDTAKEAPRAGDA